jgi:hypothetical protein
VGFFNPLVTRDETWIHIYDPETKEQFKEWRHSGSLHPKKFKTEFIRDEDGFVLVYYLEEGATITAKYYDALLDKLEQQLVSKRQASFLKESCFFKTVLLLTRQPLCTRNWQMFTLKF